MHKDENGEIEPKEPNESNDSPSSEIPNANSLDSLYQNWFLEYASYVILERAIPSLEDGLKPVQRRIMHSMKEIDDNRFHKVAGIIGHAMQYHPHGDAAICDAIVNLGQKDLLIETQGNWGDTRTGDSAAAARYIEARLTPFAKEVMFHSGVTKWQKSYDGRRDEPLFLPVKFPLLLAQGVEGIAVGLATKVMPHNFNELLDASCDILKGKKVEIFPDFPNGGTADFSNYNGGKKGGRIRIRANMHTPDRKVIVITDLPYGTTTSSLIDSVIKANDNGKIKIKKITDNTAKHIEIVIELPSGICPETTMDALYAFTDCETSISPNCCVIINDKPRFIRVEDLLEKSTRNTVDTLRKELEIALHDLQEKWHFSFLEKLFIENKIYRKIEECETWETVISCISSELKPFAEKFLRTISDEDIVKLTEIKIKRISKFNNNKAIEYLSDLEKQIKEVKDNLDNLIDYVIDYFKSLKRKYGKNYPRQTKIQSFGNIVAAKVAVANQKLYVNRKDGFVGYGLKKDEYICDCSDIDDVITFLQTGLYKVTKIADKTFVGKDILHSDIWKKGDDRQVYNVLYRDGSDGAIYAKRFSVTATTREKEYDLTKKTKGSKILYFTANPNAETETIAIHLHPKAAARNKVIDFDFAELAIKGRSSQGNIVTKHPVSRVVQKNVGNSSLGPIKVWYNEDTGQINSDEKGSYLGTFDTKDLVLSIYKDGRGDLLNCEIGYQYKTSNVKVLEKHDETKVYTVIHHDGHKQHTFVKRFQLESNLLGKEFSVITDHPDSKLLHIFTESQPSIKLFCMKRNQEVEEIIDLNTFIDVKGWKATGNRLSTFEISKIIPIVQEQPKEELVPENQNEENTPLVKNEENNEAKQQQIAEVTDKQENKSTLTEETKVEVKKQDKQENKSTPTEEAKVEVREKDKQENADTSIDDPFDEQMILW